MSNIKCPQLIKYYASHILGKEVFFISFYLAFIFIIPSALNYFYPLPLSFYEKPL